MDNTYFNRENITLEKCPFNIFVDQAGYCPNGKKTAVLNFPSEDFYIADENDNCVYKGKTVHFGLDPNSGDDIYTADFSEFGKVGRYRAFSGKERSAIFEIGENVYEKVFCDTVKAFYFLRCGTELEEKYAGKYTHKKCHSSAAALWEDKNAKKDVSGGWHDAGDYGRYVTPAATAAAHLLYAYKMFPEAFGKINPNIPESDMPDILSECKYELLWLLKMQRADGAVYHKVTTQRHAPFVMPEDDKEQLYIFPVSSMAAADFTAVCALASGIYKQFDPDFSEKLLSAAERSCKYITDNPGFVGFYNPEGCNTGSYGQRNDDSNRFWAYAEMYGATGNVKYHEKMKEALDRDFPLHCMGYSETGGLGALSYLLCERETDSELRDRFEKVFHESAERFKKDADKCGYGCSMDKESYGWGSNMQLMIRGMIFAVSDCLSGTDRYSEYAAAQLHYLLGVNAVGYSYVTGNGEFRCNHPHLRPAYADGIEECIPGMISGGANRNPADADAKILVPEGTPPMKCYADDVGCYSLNEITIYWNSPAVFVLAFLNRNAKND